MFNKRVKQVKKVKNHWYKALPYCLA